MAGPVSNAATADDYWSLPEGARAELIDGQLWDLASPSRVHQEILAELTVRVRAHVAQKGGPCKVYPAPFAVNLFADNTTFVEPDVSVVCDREKLSDRGCEGAPDLVVEIVSPSNRGMDYVTKTNLYRDAGVREYWIVDPAMARTTVYHYENDPAPIVYPFAGPVPVMVFGDLQVDLSQIVAGM